MAAKRRSTAEVRALILDAATEQFSSRGYAETTMRSIATAADISLSVLHRQFPSKESLFSATLLTPFLDSFAEFAEAWSGQVESPWDDERLVREFVRDLYRNLAEHRHTLVTLLAAEDTADAQLIDEVRRRLVAGLADLRSMAEHEAHARGWFPPEAVRFTNALVIAMVTGLVLVGPWMAGAIGDDEETLIDAATRLALYGFRFAPPDA